MSNKKCFVLRHSPVKVNTPARERCHCFATCSAPADGDCTPQALAIFKEQHSPTGASACPKMVNRPS